MLAGLELGGVPIATALSLRSGLPAAFVRKEAIVQSVLCAIDRSGGNHPELDQLQVSVASLLNASDLI